jgi:hypothetical protein
LHHGGLSGNANRFAAFGQLKSVSEQPDFQGRRIKLDGFLLVTTPLVQIVDAGGKDWAALEVEYPLIHQEGDYIRKLLDFNQA